MTNEVRAGYAKDVTVLPPNGSRNVLIVDPDPASCARLGQALMRSGFEVHTASDDESAVGIAERGVVGHAVVEIHLPDLPALELVEQLKASNATLRIVVLASQPSIAMAVEAIKLGAIQYLPTPVDPEDVIAALDHGTGKVRKPGRPALLSLDALLWKHIDRALVENGGNVSAAARSLDMHRRTLQRKLRQRVRHRQDAAEIPVRPHDERAPSLEEA